MLGGRTMARRAAVVALGLGLLVTSSGCRSGWLSRCGSNSGSMANTGCRVSDPCFDSGGYGVPVSGPTGATPGMLIPGGSVPLVPGGGAVPPPNELPPPGLIPPQSIPAAPPTAAPPGTFGAGEASRSGQPTRK